MTPFGKAIANLYAQMNSLPTLDDGDPHYNVEALDFNYQVIDPEFDDTEDMETELFGKPRLVVDNS